MNTNNLLTMLVGEQLKAVRVKFQPESKDYSYLCPFDVKEGDEVIVKVPQGHHKIVKVSKVFDALEVNLSEDYSYKFVVSKVDTSTYDMLMEAREDLQREILKQQNKTMLQSALEAFGLSDTSKVESIIKNTQQSLQNVK